MHFVDILPTDINRKASLHVLNCGIKTNQLDNFYWTYLTINPWTETWFTVN